MKGAGRIDSALAACHLIGAIMLGLSYRQLFAISLFVLFDVIVLGCVILLLFQKIQIF